MELRSIRQEENSRFDHIIVDELPIFFKLNISTQFLIPRITYNINLVHKFKLRNHGTCVPFKYKLDEEVDYSAPFIPEVREDGWLITRLYQFTCHQREQHFTIECLPLLPRGTETHIIEGIELCPVEYETQEENTVNIQSMSNMLDTDWEEKFPIDYVNLIKLSKNTKQWTTKKELYSILRQGFPIDNGEKWLSITKNMEKRLMISSTTFFDQDKWIWKPPLSLALGSRFNVVAESHATNQFTVNCKIKSETLSILTTYSCHLIYKLPENYSSLQCLVKVYRFDLLHLLQAPWYIYLMPPHTPVIGSNVDGNPSYTRKLEGHPKMRKDGWMECQIWEVSTSFRGTISVDLIFESADKEEMIVDLVVQGIEFRPL